MMSRTIPAGVLLAVLFFASARPADAQVYYQTNGVVPVTYTSYYPVTVYPATTYYYPNNVMWYDTRPMNWTFNGWNTYQPAPSYYWNGSYNYRYNYTYTPWGGYGRRWR